MDSILARGSNYFDIRGLPVAVRVSQSHPGSDDPPAHPYDLTTINHHHDFCELVFVTHGFGTQCLEGKDLPVKAGDVFLFQGHQSHYFHHRDHLKLINVMYREELIGQHGNHFKQMPGYGAMFLLEPSHRKRHNFASSLSLSREQLTSVEDILSVMISEQESKDPGFEVVIRAKLLELITYVSRAYMGVEKTSESQSLLRISKLISVMENTYEKNWTLDEFVKLSGMSKSSLLLTFRKAVGQTPLAYLLSLRIQRAGELLKSSSRQITDIAYEVGFNDSNYFTRQFKQITGHTPRDFREKFSEIKGSL